MQQAKLIKQRELSEQKPAPAQSAESKQGTIVRRAMNTARAWVQDHQTAKRLNPRQQFAALFS